MRIAILCQEEPIFLGPFLRRVMAMHPDRVAAVLIAGRRGAGERHGSLRDRQEALRIFWLIMEPRDFLASLLLRLRARILGPHDPRSVEAFARCLRLPVHRVDDPNGSEFRHLLREVSPDAVLNQSEGLLKSETLGIPRLGFVNRHASLLPAFRGRMACFWSHAADEPRYGLTIHVVDEGVDTGPIILQEEFRDVDSAWAYPQVMRRLMSEAPALFWKAMDAFECQDFTPKPHLPTDKPRRFPTLEEARQYRRTLSRRRASAAGTPA